MRISLLSEACRTIANHNFSCSDVLRAGRTLRGKETKDPLDRVLSIGFPMLLQTVHYIQMTYQWLCLRRGNQDLLACFVLFFFSPVYLHVFLFIYWCVLFIFEKTFLLGLLGTSSRSLFLVLLLVLLFLVPWVKRDTGNGVRYRKRKTFRVIKDDNPDTQVKLKNKRRQWKTLNHRISC